MATQTRRDQPELTVTESATFVASPAAPAQARAFVGALLVRWGAHARRDELALITSELVSNAYLHGIGAIDVELASSGGALLLEVTTAAGETEPQVVDRGHGATSGRGLQIVETLSEAWGHERDAHDNLSVWVRVALDGSQPGTSR